MNTDKEELQTLVEGDVSFSVLYNIIGGECDHIFTDGEEVIICHSNPPYPVWAWCKDIENAENVEAIGKCIKENFPLTEYDIVIEERLMEKLSEADEYFGGYKVKTRLLSYILDKVNDIDRACGGRMEMAEYKDLETLAHIHKDAAFEMEGYDFSLDNCREDVGYMIEDGILFVWRNDDGEIVATATREDVGKFGKISTVYTLPEHRRRGYAMNLVKGITELLVNDGLIPALYTDGEYSASNECYKKIGYQQVGKLIIANKK
jgi:GNAT superfamily N-acetyltransferase